MEHNGDDELDGELVLSFTQVKKRRMSVSYFRI